MSAKNGPMVRGVRGCPSGWGILRDETSPGGILGRSASRGSNPYERGASMKSTVRKTEGRWHWVCPCGYHGSTRCHWLALLIAVEHEHRVVSA